ncbi:hypothetical protein ACJW31_12G060400 [Castanea mollissima]
MVKMILLQKYGNLLLFWSLLCMLQKVAPVHAFQEATKISSKF